MRYGCIRTRSHSPAPSGPRLSQMAFDTPRRPRPWTSPGPPERPDLGLRSAPALAPAAAASSETARAWPSVYGRLEVDEVGDGQQRRVELRLAEATPSAGSAPITASQVLPASSPSRIVSALRTERSGQDGVELRPGPLVGQRHRRSGAARCGGPPR